MTGRPAERLDRRAQLRGRSAASCPARSVEPELVEEPGEALAILGDLDRLGGQPGDRHVGIGEVPGEVDRGLTAEGEHDRGRRPGQRPLVVDDVEHRLGVERLEVQARAGVVVGADRLGVVVDHDRVEPHLANRPRGAHAAVVELDPLADADRSGADDDHAAAARPVAAPRARRRCE